MFQFPFNGDDSTLLRRFRRSLVGLIHVKPCGVSLLGSTSGVPRMKGDLHLLPSPYPPPPISSGTLDVPLSESKLLT